MVSSKSHIKTRSVVDSGVVGETVLCLRPLPLVPLVSDPELLPRSLVRRVVLSGFKGEFGGSVSDNPFDGLSTNVKHKNVNNNLCTSILIY